MPVFEGLLPDRHNGILMDLLFMLAHWHALAKLRQHTDLSLSVLESVTIQLGKCLRKFHSKTCSAFDTRELKREEAARNRRTQRATAARKRSTKNTDSVAVFDTETVNPPSPPKETHSPKKAAGKRSKTLNLKTYKDHSLGDYVETIRRNGTTDSYSTETVSYHSQNAFSMLTFY